MKKTKPIEVNVDGYRLVFKESESGGLAVDAYNAANKLIMEWEYGMVPVPKFTANVLFWTPQALLQAKAEEKKLTPA
jgi:hypothetical protein